VQEDLVQDNNKWPGKLANIIGIVIGIFWLVVGFLSTFFLKENWQGVIFSLLPGFFILFGLLISKRWPIFGAIVEFTVAISYFVLLLINWSDIETLGFIIVALSLIVPALLIGIFLIFNWKSIDRNNIL